MKTLLALLLFAGAALAEDPKPKGGTGTVTFDPINSLAGYVPVELHLADAQLRDYYRYLGELQTSQRAVTDAQAKLDKVVSEMRTTCKNGIIADAAKGFDCAKAPEKPAEKK